MAIVGLHIEDLANRLTLKALLEAEGHRVDPPGEEAEVMIADDPQRAVALSSRVPVLLLAPLGEIGRAVEAMYKGVYGYIVLPLQPGEAAIMVERALGGVNARGGAEEAAAALRSLADAEADHILWTLRQCKYNQARAARVLGIGRNTLWRKLKAMGRLPDAEGKGAGE
jgi:DNA-binding NtrC family response regulator